MQTRSKPYLDYGNKGTDGVNIRANRPWILSTSWCSHLSVSYFYNSLSGLSPAQPSTTMDWLFCLWRRVITAAIPCLWKEAVEVPSKRTRLDLFHSSERSCWPGPSQLVSAKQTRCVSYIFLSDGNTLADYSLDTLKVDTGGEEVSVGLKDPYKSKSATQVSPDSVVSTCREWNRVRTLFWLE